MHRFIVPWQEKNLLPCFFADLQPPTLFRHATGSAYQRYINDISTIYQRLKSSKYR